LGYAIAAQQKSEKPPPEQLPEGYQQLEDGSWLSPEAYQSILRQSQRSLPRDVRRLRDYE